MMSSNALSQGEGIAYPHFAEIRCSWIIRRVADTTKSWRSACASPHSWFGVCGKDYLLLAQKQKAMARPLRLALILLLMCAGLVVAAPVVTNSNQHQPSSVVGAAPKPLLNDFILQVDSKAGCVWRVPVATGRRELDPLPCKRPKNRTKSARS